MIEREEMQEVVKKYKHPKLLILGSHSALDAAAGARDYGLKSIIFTTPQRAIIYLQNPTVGDPKDVIEDLPDFVRNEVLVSMNIKDFKKEGWKRGIFIVDEYSDIVGYVDELIDLECIQIPNRALTVYVGGDEKCSVIEKDYAVPFIGSRKLLKIENRGELEKDYYWYAKQAGIPTPKEFKFKIKKEKAAPAEGAEAIGAEPGAVPGATAAGATPAKAAPQARPAAKEAARPQIPPGAEGKKEKK